MDRAAFVHKRKKRYMAQLLDEFDAEIAPLIPEDKASHFKGIVRQKLHALALDAIETFQLPSGVEVNAVAVELRDDIERSHRA